MKTTLRLVYLFLFFFLCALSSHAQVQQGLVNTRGRIDSNGVLIHGTGVENVVIKIKNESSVISDTCGTFEICLKGNKYFLENVSKKGYQLVDIDILSKQYTCSPDTLKIVLTTPEQQLEDELASERKLRRTLNRQLQQREDEIEELYATNKILKSERDSALQKLYASHTDNEKLIKDMVERYSRIDFDQLDDFNRKISEYILDGELVKADSLLNSKGDIHSRIEQFRAHEQLNRKERAELSEREKTLARSEELIRKELEDIAGDCYSKFEIFNLQHLNDSAAYYIELRAELDATNAEWQFDAGNFVSEYMADYDKANNYYYKALRSAIDKYGEWHPDVAVIYENIGHVHSYQSNYTVALEYYRKALEIRLESLGENYASIATSYNNIGYVNSSQGNYPAALEYYQKAYEIRLEIYGERHIDVATCYNNIGGVHYSKGDYTKALEYYHKSLEIHLDTYGERHPDVALSYNNIGSVHSSQGDYPVALEYYCKALEILMRTFGECHPYVTKTYFNIGYVHFFQNDYPVALEYYHKALEIDIAIYGEHHPNVAMTYKSISNAHSFQGNYPVALEYEHKALEIYIAAYGEHNVDVARSYSSIAYILFVQGNFYNSLVYYEKSYSILKELLPSGHRDVLMIQNVIEVVKSKITGQ